MAATASAWLATALLAAHAASSLAASDACAKNPPKIDLAFLLDGTRRAAQLKLKLKLALPPHAFTLCLR